MSILELVLFSIFFLSHTIFLIIVLYNLSTAPRLTNSADIPESNLLVSILIPARNEEKNIQVLLNSLISQSYKNMEILVLDDHSTDETFSVTKNLADKYPQIKLISGEDLPEGWLGKNWACNQLARQAKGDYLLFIDADVWLSDNAVLNAVSALKKNNVSMLSVFPTQKIQSFGEWSIVPLMNWLLLNFLPLKFVYLLKNQKFTAANGQFILIKKSTYNLIGTHRNLKEIIVEDMAMAKSVKGKGEKVITLLGDNSIYCRMYDGFNSAYKGFSKNFFPGFSTSKPFFFLILVMLFTLFFSPILFYLINNIFLIIVLMIALERVFVSLLSKQNWFLNIILHPLQMILMLLIGLRSIKGSNIEWKGRSI